MLGALAGLLVSLTGVGGPDVGCADLTYETPPALVRPHSAFETNITYRATRTCERVSETCPAGPAGEDHLRFDVVSAPSGLVVSFHPASFSVPPGADPTVVQGTTKVRMLADRTLPAFREVEVNIRGGACGYPKATNTTKFAIDYYAWVSPEGLRVDRVEGWSNWTLLLTNFGNGPTRVRIDPAPAKAKDPGSQWVAGPEVLLTTHEPGNAQKAYVMARELRSGAYDVNIVFKYAGPEPPPERVQPVRLASHLTPHGGVRFEGHSTPWLGAVALATVLVLAVGVRRRGPTP